jgi:DNA-binding NtrC family response regulator
VRRRILIVDDDARIRVSLSEALAADEAEVGVAVDAAEALARISTDRPDLVLSDVRMPGVDGIELLRRIRATEPGVAVVMMTAYDDLETVAAAMREGALEFLVKPLDLHVVRRVIDRVLSDREMAAAEATAGADPSTAPPESHAPLIVGRDPRMIEVFKLVGRVARSRTCVIVRGESGTGKELVARAIHAASPFSSQPLVAVNCTSLPGELLESELFGHLRGSFTGATSDRKGRFAAAGRGTVFLDEIGDMPLSLQAKLLRVLQEHEFYPVGADRAERMQARVISATHRDLEERVASGSFRQDLYYRLRVLEIQLPPLRERPDDLEPLAQHLLRKACNALGRGVPMFSPEALLALRAHDWPGNVRELENALIRAAVMTQDDVLRSRHLALDTGSSGSGAESDSGLSTLADLERDHVTRVLRATGGHKARTAQILGVSRPRLDRLLRKYEIAGPGGESSADGEPETS